MRGLEVIATLFTKSQWKWVVLFTAVIIAIAFLLRIYVDYLRAVRLQQQIKLTEEEARLLELL